ncbi:ATP-binding protein [uncultured Tenacibaculum sp.]|uniref:sensor histidine kinase n=1 Tax=uncultured Tenacibaculum sp. TaxID=174713 RepID=UPI00261B297C|nr:ATP-binding protein [uncultured Tenacibaculum sp.]
MEQDNKILDILRLYEYSMSIGKSLDYYENCNSFLKLLLTRRNLNACWILNLNEKNQLTKKYSIPHGNDITPELSPNLKSFLNSINNYIIIEYSQDFKELVPIKVNEGTIVIYKLYQGNYLFLYTNTSNIYKKNSEQLLPVISKFSHTLEACMVFEKKQKLLEQLEEKNKDLSNYAHIVSHDLRSPLRNIETLVTWLKADHVENLNNEAVQFLDSISDNIHIMESLVKGILEYSTINRNDFNFSKLDLNHIINKILQYTNAPENIEITVSKDFPSILGNEHRIQQLFQNLIGNAIKYNDKEKGLIEVGFFEEDEKTVYYVKDNGKGIEKEYHSKIFNAFLKLEDTKDSIGIGLSIVKKIISNYGGKIWLTSELGKGTTFFFTLEK